MGFELPELEYAYDSLEPYIDAETMELHHSKHHAGYTAKLNAAIEGTDCLLYTSPSPRDVEESRMPSSA